MFPGACTMHNRSIVLPEQKTSTPLCYKTTL